ncbi:flagellar basal body rod protein FlgB [Desulfuromonas acetoxidans]|uniref:Flagellar basal body rod protein FlgB n=1 Tax=Desulfuromonas acetoxidans (strain DSM 684 / 11070) TaxID=281689 RepID=Q1JZU2_DESA6|nr:flagellar basal body rod protein FlgB [Desulfuromonas acetoxidans]EAT15800.1 flagellar basal-body rod protein FlgB [Desulfuromonas acetoxidans DSM 684]MBF0644998.1 flagellar basal body rod protein FlgB [Desulfuromonas acetoxidans]NVD25654.1 flagellar basal body rod protein FlgB [Desulfuromonas acetoxidans]NVE17707.1 flagellar basal body rod protein FlgB [Desulfuromonas acetoxidans]
MMTSGMMDQTALLMKKSMDLRLRNQQIIAANVANAQTPGYQAKTFTFEDALRQAATGKGTDMAVTHPQHISTHGGSINNVTGTVGEIRDTSGMGDRNTVEVDQEMVNLAENQIMYEATTQLLNKKLSIVKYVVQGT